MHVQALNFQFRFQSSKDCSERANYEAAFGTDNEKSMAANKKLESFADKKQKHSNMSNRWEQFIETKPGKLQMCSFLKRNTQIRNNFLAFCFNWSIFIRAGI